MTRGSHYLWFYYRLFEILERLVGNGFLGSAFLSWTNTHQCFHLWIERVIAIKPSKNIKHTNKNLTTERNTQQQQQYTPNQNNNRKALEEKQQRKKNRCFFVIKVHVFLECVQCSCRQRTERICFTLHHHWFIIFYFLRCIFVRFFTFVCQICFFRVR